MTTILQSRLAFGLIAALLVTSRPGHSEEAFETVDQHMLSDMVAGDQGAEAFLWAFEVGDELSEFEFTTGDGVGANIGEGRLFTRIPRADLTGPGEWATHFPMREGGANATSCISCHSSPFANGAGGIAMNVLVDPGHTGVPSQYLERNTTPLFALAIPQRLAEDMSLQLYLQREEARDQACALGDATVDLVANGVGFGSLAMTRTTQTPCTVAIDTSGVVGVDPDLVVRPFGWKGNHATLRAFTRGAAHNELGLQATELVGAADGDFDGVTHEMSVGDITALTIYMAALERPTSRIELADLGLLELSAEDRHAVTEGETRFAEVGCSGCHLPSMPVRDPIFREPSRVPGYAEITFPDGSDPADHGLASETALTFDMRADQPNNRILLQSGGVYLLGSLEVDPGGVGIAHWYSDFRRHDMGEELADPADPLGIGAAMFLTRSLAGVGSTGPWLHDGRATSLTEAILAHGGEAAGSRDAYAALNDDESAEIVTFLENLVLYHHDPDL